jgi:hypothetical protein
VRRTGKEQKILVKNIALYRAGLRRRFLAISNQSAMPDARCAISRFLGLLSLDQLPMANGKWSIDLLRPRLPDSRFPMPDFKVARENCST